MTLATRKIKPSHSGSLDECIQICQQCHDVCLDIISYCLEKGGRHAEPKHIRLLESCAEICQTSANFMLRDSELHTATCRACSEVCEACADQCEKMGDDSRMKECADICRQCAESCRQMSAA